MARPNLNRRMFLALTGVAGLQYGATAMAKEGEFLSRELKGAKARIRFSRRSGTQTDEKSRSLVLSWIDQSAEAVSGFYGKFPVPLVDINVEFHGLGGRVGGTAYPDNPPDLQLRVPEKVSQEALMRDDWVLVHEMTHLAFPHFRRRRHNWMVEGLAVYVEPVARIMTGQLDEKHMWGEFMEMMPHGLPGRGDGGLDQTRDHGRIYWGGALFCLMCDIRCRQETANKKGLRDALVAINARTDFTQTGDLAELLAMGDRATGTSVLMDSWKEARNDAVAPDLDALWQSLGVAKENGRVVFDNAAPLAEIRRSITDGSTRI